MHYTESGFHWHHDDGGYSLIARYDPEGWDVRWTEDPWFQGLGDMPETDEPLDPEDTCSN